MQTSSDAHISANASRRFDKNSKTWISFKSETDALFASTWLGEQLGDEPLASIGAISAILTLLKNPDFHAEQLSYDTGIDVLTNIAVSRHKTALTRSISYSPKEGQIANNVPSVIVDLVAQEFGKDVPLLPTFQDDSYYRAYTRFMKMTPEQKALKNMCLVHRSWTIPARRILSRSADVSGQAGLYNALRNPDFGPSTRVLYYVGDVDNRETRQLLSAVIKKCPGLRALGVNSVLDFKDQQLLEDIASLQNLEKLEMGRDDFHEESSSLLLMDVCLALPRMESLKSLTLYGFICNGRDKFPSSLHKLSPCSRLTEVNLLRYYAEENKGKWDDSSDTGYHRYFSSAPTTIDCISWIFKPRKDYNVISTTINLDDVYEPEEGLTLNEHGDALVSAFKGLQTLNIIGGINSYKIRKEDLESHFAEVKGLGGNFDDIDSDGDNGGSSS